VPLGFALVGVTLVVFDVLYGRGVAAVAGAVSLGGFAILRGDVAAVDAQVRRSLPDPFALTRFPRMRPLMSSTVW
jgi:exosortase/archaeosortase